MATSSGRISTLRLVDSGRDTPNARLRLRAKDPNGSRGGWPVSSEPPDDCVFEGMVGSSPQFMQVVERIRKVAPHFRVVLITGATGTGKELVARTLHRLSPVAAGPFVACNCSAIVETLFESELFGHVKGAFTGAVSDKRGFVEAAHRGTLLLDEIGDIPRAIQAKILRLLESGEYHRVGSTEARHADLRVVAATNFELRTSVREKQFREDLFYRLSALEIHLPALRERTGDLTRLIRHFLREFASWQGKQVCGLTEAALRLLSSYSWPGNIRELENVLTHACIMTESDLIDIPDLPEHLHGYSPRAIISPGELVPLREVVGRYVQQVLGQVEGNKSRAAEILQVGRSTLYRLSKASD